MNPPDPSSSRFDALWSLFERARDLPSAEREAFVRSQTVDGSIADEVLSLLGGSEAPAPTRLDPGPESAAPSVDKVQSTATDELLKNLATAPTLDTRRFALEGELGKGGMGVVMKIYDQHLRRRLAMKVLIERGEPQNAEERRLVHQLLGRFLEEAQVTSQLDHPGVVPVHELGLDQSGRVYFTMRLVKGRTAREVFADAHAEQNDWTVTRALEVILKVCDTMSYAHEKGVLHRDLKPSNVMVGRFGEVYVMDWGLAKVVGHADRHDLRIREDASAVSGLDTARQRDAETDSGSSVVSMDGEQLGTPSYMAPEQARSEVLDGRADVYSIGAMLYELLAGRAPYTSPGVRQPAYRILNDVVEGPPKRIEDVQKGVPAELVAISDKAMSRAREQRYANTGELAAELRSYLAQRTVKAYRTGALVEMKLWVRRNRALASSLAAAALILVAGIAFTSLYAAENKTLLTEAQAEAEKNRIFADVAKLAEATWLEAELYPAFPDKVPAMEAWLREFREPLAARLPALEKALEELRARAKPVTEEQRKVAREQHPRWPELQRLHSGSPVEDDPSARDTQREEIATLQNEIEVAGFEFADGKDGYLHRILTRLVKEQGEFVGSKVPSVEKRLSAARSVKQQTIDAYQAKWDEAIAAIKASDGKTASQLYEHFELTPQLGLVPLGMDKESKLWEFVHMASGTPGKEIPQRDPATQRLIPTGDMGIVFVLLPGGALPAGTVDQGNENKTSVRLGVRLDPFFLGKYEVTQGQWVRITGTNPSYYKKRSDLALPVEQVDWFDSEEVLRHEGLVLPSELRWEYAIRAGTTTKWWTGDTEESAMAKENIVGIGLLPVGSQTANGFGLFDMGGNVWEWCLDVYGDYGTEQVGDGLRPMQADGAAGRCYRGGPFILDPGSAQSGDRAGYAPSFGSDLLGLRAARTSRL